MDRRELTRRLTAAIAAAGVRFPWRGRERLGRIGIQLYTVRSLMARQPERTLTALKAIGYGEVEFAGYGRMKAAEVKAMLGRVGLTAPAGHVDISLLGDRWPATVKFMREAGHQYLVVGWIPPEERQRLDQFRSLAARLNQAAEAARTAGLRFAYHNHDYEFAALDGRRPYDTLLEETNRELVELELDLYWVMKSGGDPLTYFAAWPGRFPMVHVKDMDRQPTHGMVDVGRGTIDFARIFKAAPSAGVKHFFVEHDEPKDPMATARASYDYLRRLEY